MRRTRPASPPRFRKSPATPSTTRAAGGSSISSRAAPRRSCSSSRSRDTGPAFADLEAIPGGALHLADRHGTGDYRDAPADGPFRDRVAAGKGTTVWLKKLLPARAGLVKPGGPGAARGCVDRGTAAGSPFQELQHQNQELLRALEEIRSRQAELMRLNRELEDTNRGVVALYAELDEKADHLRRADELKSKFLSNMSHEFRSPLNSILALSGLLLDRSDGELSSEQDQQVGYITPRRPGPAGTGERSARSGQSGGREKWKYGRSNSRPSICSLRCAGCCGRCC